MGKVNNFYSLPNESGVVASCLIGSDETRSEWLIILLGDRPLDLTAYFTLFVKTWIYNKPVKNLMDIFYLPQAKQILI